MNNTIILIPSRLAASRLPNKPLLKINNLSIINHVYQKAKESNIGDVYVATGDKEIFNDVKLKGGKCILTEKDHSSGTDRIFEAYQKLGLKNIEYIINLQGDEPIIDVKDIINLYKKTLKNSSEMSTLACEILNKNAFTKESVVKVITEEKLSFENSSKAKVFSRIILKNDYKKTYHHIGIYMYKVSILEKIINLKQTENELLHKLEQLRAMENNIDIDVNFANSSPIGVDTYEDYIKIKNLMENKN